ncbi:MAG: hypothetical protein ABI333_26590 [bacterium]
MTILRKATWAVLFAVTAAAWMSGCSVIVDEKSDVVYQVCNNGVREGSEECDGSDFGDRTCEWYNGQGSTGSLYCNNCVIEIHDCTGTSSCGNGVCDEDEDHFNCPNDCPVPGECGNGQINPGEECDAPDLGGHSCQSLSYEGGPLGCTDECGFDTSSCFQLPNGEPCQIDHNCLGGLCHWGPGFGVGVCTEDCAGSGNCQHGGFCDDRGPLAETRCYKPCGSDTECRDMDCQWVIVVGQQICWPGLLSN